ncbi:hypothetical protein CHH55_23530 [Niallia circulans]|uniref:hypothetical protein n=1 Tax=Niallia TaxID=2837506 RepID=UPI000BA573CB|nr:hypothetical protein [Niallia circulans]PAD85438.1 hypothetical protein CHH55_23530 [Niallia circulans]PAE09794.1 hypothetical protein CHI02_23310 [Niallia circulans]
MNLALGAAIDFSGIELPFSVGDLIGSGSALLMWIGSFVLLGLAFAFAPKLVGIIVNSFKKAAGGTK